MIVVLNGLRSILFNIAFYGAQLITLPFCLLPATLFAGRKGVRWGIWVYCEVSIWFARRIMGVEPVLRGGDILPPEGEPIILAAAHQSSMDPMLAYRYRRDVSALAKKELFAIPIIGLALRKMGVIKVDRQSGSAHTALDSVGDDIRRDGLMLIVYPQGTRVRPGKHKDLKAGVYHVAKKSGLPVYTVATTTGHFWTTGFWHRPGKAIFEVVRKLPDDLDKETFMKMLHEDVVLRSEDLYRELGYPELSISDRPN